MTRLRISRISMRSFGLALVALAALSSDRTSQKSSPASYPVRAGRSPASVGAVADDRNSYHPFVLNAGDSLFFQDLTFTFQTDGNLVLYRDFSTTQQTVLWNSQTTGRNCVTGCWMNFQSDGNLALYQNGRAFWNSRSDGHPYSVLTLSQRAPYVSVQSQEGQTFWGAGTDLQWFTALDPYGTYGSARPGAPDFMQLFEETPWSSESAPWQRSLKRIGVLKLYTQFILQGPEASLRKIFDFLKRHHIALAVEIGAVLTRSDCGFGIEGTVDLATVNQMASRIESLGGELAFVAMDEPMFFEHYNTSLGTAPAVSCQFSIPDLARNVAQTYDAVRKYFPGVMMGDVEPFFQIPSANFALEFAQFADAYKLATGQALAFVHDDSALESAESQKRIPALQGVLSLRGIPYGLIRNGNGLKSTSDAAWVTSALLRIATYNSLRLPQPAQNVFQTWDPYPTHVLPETSPTTMTFLVKTFFEGLPQPSPALSALSQFDSGFYFALYADLQRALGNVPTSLFAHWTRSGQAEGRMPSPLFDVSYYRAQYADLAAAFGGNLVAYYSHWLNNGVGEGRRASLVFDPVFYFSGNPDLRRAFGYAPAALMNHWMSNGIAEGRDGSADFSAQAYLSRYPDLRALLGPVNYKAAIEHWYAKGRSEGRNGRR